MRTPKFASDIFIPKHPEKYMGIKTIRYRSSWECDFMRFCDTHPSIIKWASEAITIPYRNPLTNKNTVYVPDFVIHYIDKNSKIHTEVIEIKPAKQAILEKVGKSNINRMQYIKNQAKWQAAILYCKQQGMSFRVLTENDLFTKM